MTIKNDAEQGDAGVRELKTILVVEDDHDSRVLIRGVLEDEGYFVFSATNGIDGIALLTRIKPPSLILLDQEMPLMNGEEFLKTVERDKSLSKIPVVLMTTTDVEIEGVHGSLAKPLTKEKLIGFINGVGFLSAFNGNHLD